MDMDEYIKNTPKQFLHTKLNPRARHLKARSKEELEEIYELAHTLNHM